MASGPSSSVAIVRVAVVITRVSLCYPRAVGTRAAFITIGQSPRSDILDELRAWWPADLEIEEFGALDHLSREDIHALAPTGDEPRLVSRLTDGTEATMRATAIHERISEIVERCDRVPYDFLVLLCTGAFDELRSRHLLLKAQPIVDHGVAAFASSSTQVGVLVPLAHQIPPSATIASHASPYEGDRWADAARELAPADLIVMHCMGYSEAMRQKMATLTGTPVLLARRLLGAAGAQLL